MSTHLLDALVSPVSLLVVKVSLLLGATAGATALLRRSRFIPTPAMPPDPAPR